MYIFQDDCKTSNEKSHYQAVGRKLDAQTDHPHTTIDHMKNIGTSSHHDPKEPAHIQHILHQLVDMYSNEL